MCINEYIAQNGLGSTYQGYIKRGAAFFRDRGVVTPNESDYAAYSAHLAEIYNGEGAAKRSREAVNALKKFYAWRDGKEACPTDGNTDNTIDDKEACPTDGNTDNTIDGKEACPTDGNTDCPTGGKASDCMKLCIRIDRAYGFALKSVASANGETIVDVVFSAIVEYLHKHEKQAEKAFDMYYNR